jgi:hypothetical protein
MSYELKQVTILEIEVETQREQIKVLKARIKELEDLVADHVKTAERHTKLVDGLIGDLTRLLGNPH